MSTAESPPFVTIVVVNYNGVEHLPACLDSVAGLDYPPGRHEVVVVDNGSTDGSVELLRERYPDVRVLVQQRNLGFAGGNNVAAASSSADCLALLNTDMAVDPNWLTELVAAYAPEEGYRCVGGLILDWSGERLDFADGAVTYYGMADQLDFGKPLDEVAIPESRDLLFACGGAMLIERETYLAVGGFDPEYFAYFEDVDLGWRLWLAGHRVRLAPRARARHRSHATGGGLPWHQRRLLLERNALRTLVKNLDEPNLWPLLSAALLILGERARVHMGSRREDYEVGSGVTDADETVRREGIAAVHAVADLVQGLPRVMEQRADVQALRQRGDAEIFELFRRPFLPMGPDATSFLEAVATVTRELGLERLFERRRATHLVVVAYDADRPGEAAAGARCRELSRALARHLRVTLAASAAAVEDAPAVELVTFGSDDELRQLAAEADVLLVHASTIESRPLLAAIPAVRVIDLDGIASAIVDPGGVALEAGDLFVCASEGDRDEWLAVLSAAGRDSDFAAADPLLRRLVDVVPDGGADAVAPIVAVCEAPWRWTSLRTRGRGRALPTEDAQLLLARRREGSKAAERVRPPHVRLARTLWGWTPERVRLRLRPALRRAQARRA